MAYRVIRSGQPDEELRGRVLSRAEAAESRGEPFLLGLSGGSTPEELYRSLAEPLSQLTRVHLIQVDERLVPADHPDSNWKMISSVLSIPAGLPDERLLRVYPGESGAEYARRVQLLLEETGRQGLDLALLGMGGDGHTASVFTAEEAARRPEAAYRTSSPRHRHERITLSLSLLSRSSLLCLLVKGEEKREALERLLKEDLQIPAAYLPPGKTEIYTNLF
jgi:6-phosphogluconolactonase